MALHGFGMVPHGFSWIWHGFGMDLDAFALPGRPLRLFLARLRAFGGVWESVGAKSVRYDAPGCGIMEVEHLCLKVCQLI